MNFDTVDAVIVMSMIAALCVSAVLFTFVWVIV